MALTKTEIDKVVNELYDDIFKFCVSKTASIDAAEEITQETFLAFTRKSKDLTNVNLRAWIYKTAGIKVKEYFRTKKAKNCFVSLQDCEELQAENVSTTHINEDEFEEILNTVQKKILSLLNDDEKQIFIKLYIEKKTVKIVSDEMGITENNVYVKSHRTKKKVKKIISNMDLLVNLIFFKLFM